MGRGSGLIYIITFEYLHSIFAWLPCVFCMALDGKFVIFVPAQLSHCHSFRPSLCSEWHVAPASLGVLRSYSQFAGVPVCGGAEKEKAVPFPSLSLTHGKKKKTKTPTTHVGGRLGPFFFEISGFSAQLAGKAHLANGRPHGPIREERLSYPPSLSLSRSDEKNLENVPFPSFPQESLK